MDNYPRLLFDDFSLRASDCGAILEGGVSSIVDSMHDIMRRGRGGSQCHSDVTSGKIVVDGPLEGHYANYVHASVCILLSLALTLLKPLGEQTEVARCGKKSLVFHTQETSYHISLAEPDFSCESLALRDYYHIWSLSGVNPYPHPSISKL